MKRQFFVLAALLTFHQLWAQQDTTLLNEAVVTASKFPGKTSQTGKVISIINAEQLSRSGGKDLSQVLTEQAGIYIGGANSNAGKDKGLYLWGASPANSLIMIDGIPVYDPSGIGGNFDLRNISISSIERIEIVKGSQSTLYGSDAIAGVINIISKKSGNAKFGGDINAGYGSYNSFRGNGNLRGQTGKLDYNLGYSFFDTKGIDETVALNNSTPGDKDDYRQQNLQAGLGWKISSQINSRAFFRYGKIKGSIDQGAYTDELDYTYTQESWQAGIKNEARFGKLQLNLLYQYNDVDRLYIDDSVKSRNGFDTYSSGSYSGHEHMIDLYGHYSMNNNLRLTLGADFRKSSTGQRYVSLPAYGPPAVLDTFTKQESIYGALAINSKTGFNMEAGGRINFHSAYGSYFVYNFNPSYLIGKKLKLFANYSTAYRTPSLYQLYSEYGNSKLKPESGRSLEGGIQFYSLKKKFTARAVAFQRKLKDGLFFYFNSSTFSSQYINQDRQKDRGLELELNYKPCSRLDIRASYNYVTGTITTKNAGKDTSYFNLLRRPKNAGNLAIGYKGIKQLYLSTSFFIAGKRHDAYFDSNSFSTVNVLLPSNALLNFYAEYELKSASLKFYIDLRNITGTQYMEIAGFRTMGLNGMAGLCWKW